MAQARHRNGIGGPQAEPVTLAETKTHLRVDHANDDDYINDLIVVVTDYTERVCERSIIEKTYDQYYDNFPAADSIAIKLPYAPLISITSIKYFDDQDVEQTWSSAEYEVDTTPMYYGLVYPGRNYSWPSPRIFRKSVHIEYIAGYQNSAASPVDWADNVPLELKQAILVLIGHYYENRESSAAGIVIEEVPDTYDSLIRNFRRQLV